MDNQKVVVLGLCENWYKLPDWIEEFILPAGFEVELTTDGINCLNGVVYGRMQQYEGCRVSIYVDEPSKQSMILLAALVTVTAACKDYKIPLKVYYSEKDMLIFVPQEV